MTTLTDKLSNTEFPSKATAAEASEHQKKIAQLETLLQTPLQLAGVSDKRYTMAERMARYTVPGVSMAFIENGKIAWTKTWGTADNSTQQPLTADTLFQAASTSKPVAALGALKMVENGDLSLAAPINNYLGPVSGVGPA